MDSDTFYGDFTVKLIMRLSGDSHCFLHENPRQSPD